MYLFCDGDGGNVTLLPLLPSALCYLVQFSLVALQNTWAYCGTFADKNHICLDFTVGGVQCQGATGVQLDSSYTEDFQLFVGEKMF